MTKKTARSLHRARVAAQALFFGVFIYVFVRSLDPFTPGENPFLRFDPLVFLTHLKFELRFVLPIAGILALTLAAGRFFCGWVCPLGSLVDLLDLVASPLRKINPLKGWKAGFGALWAKHPPSWIILGATVPAIFFTPPVLQFFHPNVWIVRIFSLSTLGVAFLGLLIVFSTFSRRFWCAYLCPLGSLYGLIGRMSVFRLSISRCSRCGRCETCPMDAAPASREGGGPDAAGYWILRHQCILCFDYEERCPVQGFRYAGSASISSAALPKDTAALLGPSERARSRLEFPPGSGGTSGFAVPAAETGQGGSGLSRRDFLRGGVVLLGGLAVGSGLSVFDRTVDTNLIRPPGVLDDTLFVKRCLRCFQCVRSCPNKIIKITGIETGFDSLFTPHIEFNEYGCDYTCQVCQQVCPNYAIPLQPLPVKQTTKMGLAAIDRRLCVVYARDTNCLVCEEFCPIPDKAVKLVDKVKVIDGEPVVLRYPIVDTARCNGCGKCEGNCPATDSGVPAILVSRVSGA